MRAAGFSTTPYKLAAFIVAGALAGLAGLLLAVKDGAVNPELLSWHESGAVLLMLILGGIGSLRGAVLGAIAFTLLKELFQSEALLGPLAGHWQLTLGLTIIAFVAALPRGLIGLGARVRGLMSGRAARPRREDRRERGAGRIAAPRASAALGVAARGDRPRPALSAASPPSTPSRSTSCVGEIHAVIGTNGAGKSTLINMLSGELAPSAGTVRFAGHDVTRWSQPRRARAGTRPQLPADDDLRRVQRARELPPRRAGERASGRGWSGSAPPHDRRGIAIATRALAAAGLDGDAGRIGVDAQPRRQAPARDRDVPGHRAARAAARRAARRHGRRRDRPHARRCSSDLKATHAILLVEHDMDAVFRVADRITVMVNGEVIASDVPERIRSDPAVRLAYLGDAH